MTIMQTIFLSFALALSFSLKAESEFVTKTQKVYIRMIEAKTEKDRTIRGSKGQPEIQRAATIQGALQIYSEQMAELAEEGQRLRDQYSGKITPADEAVLDASRAKLREYIHNESAMEEAAREINILANQEP